MTKTTQAKKRRERLLKILEAEQAVVTATDLATKLGVTERTIRSDVKAMEAEGVPIEIRRARGGGISLFNTTERLSDHTYTGSVIPKSGTGTPFIGRAQEMARITAAFDDAIEGRGGLVMLAGEPGIGKTRLTEELTHVAVDRNTLVIRGACYEGGNAPPYWPWTQTIRSLLTEPSEAIVVALGSGAAVIAEIFPDIKNVVSNLENAPVVDPEQARFRLFNTITSFLSEISVSKPLVIVLDDLHWADRSSLDLLEFVAREVSTTSMLLVGSYRDTELSRQHPLSATLGALARVRKFQRIPLRGLGHSEVGRLVEAVGDIALPVELIEEIHDRTEGNPFFIAEVTRDLSREAIERGGDVDFVGSFRIPEGVREAVGIRLNQLSEECNETLRTAAVIGREFEFSLLATVSAELSEDVLLGAVNDGLGASVIRDLRGPDERYEFTHALIQQTLADELSTSQQTRLHAEIVSAIERLYGDNLENHSTELAYHSEEAGSAIATEKVIRYAFMAGERALATYAWEEALDHFQRGLAAKDGPDMDADTAALLFGLARAQSRTLERHRIHEAVSTVRPAFDYYVAAGDVLAVSAIAEYPFDSEVDLSLAQLLVEALELMPSDSRQAGLILSRYGLELGRGHGNFESAVEALGQALAIAQRENDSALEMAVLSNTAAVHFMMRLDPEQCLENSLKAIELGRRVSQIGRDHGGHFWAAVALVALGDLEGAWPHAGAQLESAEKRGGHYRVVQALFVSEAIAHLQGDWQKAREFSARGLAVSHTDARLVSNRTILEYELGYFDQGDIYLERLIETMHLTPHGPTLEHSLTCLAIGIAARITGVTRHFEIAEEAAGSVLSSLPPLSFFTQLTRTGLALIAAERGDATAAREQYDALISWRAALVPLNLICRHRVLGLLAQTLNRMEDAIAHFEESLAFCQKAGARPELAWTSYDYAIALLQRDEVGDRFRAMSLVDQALTISTELGMRPLMEWANLLQEKARLLPARKPEYPAGLTSREVEVLRLVASGKSNAEISEDLVLSVRTVERHISNIYVKTGSAGRANATAFAFISGLMPVDMATE